MFEKQETAQLQDWLRRTK